MCLDRDEGPFPIRSFTGDIGGRVALGVSQGSLAFPSSRLNTDRLPTVVELLKRKARAIGALVNPFNPTLRRPAQSLAPPDSDWRSSHLKPSCRKGMQLAQVIY